MTTNLHKTSTHMYSAFLTGVTLAVAYMLFSIARRTLGKEEKHDK